MAVAGQRRDEVGDIEAARRQRGRHVLDEHRRPIAAQRLAGTEQGEAIVSLTINLDDVDLQIVFGYKRID